VPDAREEAERADGLVHHDADIGAGPAGGRQDEANGEENPGHLARPQ
jgi:hypothetical protein